jgi:hypothetical protein
VIEAAPVSVAEARPVPVPVTVTVIVVVPGATPVTTPAALTVAMLEDDEVYVEVTVTVEFARFTVGTPSA